MKYKCQRYRQILGMKSERECIAILTISDLKWLREFLSPLCNRVGLGGIVPSQFLWKPGDKLPSESDIAQMYGVNRLSVRMALQKPGTLGIIETRVGEGSFVQEFSFYPVLSEMVDFLQYGERLDDIREMRFLIERASAKKLQKLTRINPLDLQKSPLFYLSIRAFSTRITAKIQILAQGPDGHTAAAANHDPGCPVSQPLPLGHCLQILLHF